MFDFAVDTLHIDFTDIAHMKTNFKNWKKSVNDKKDAAKISGPGNLPEAEFNQLDELIDEVLIGPRTPVEQVGLSIWGHSNK